MDGIRLILTENELSPGQKAKITPGRWGVDQYGYIIAGERCLGAVNCEADTEANKAERMANAHLWAASPQLATALALCVAALKANKAPTMLEIQAMGAAEAAIEAASFTIPHPLTGREKPTLTFSGKSITL